MDPKKIRKLYMQVLPKLNGALQHVQSQLSDMPPSDFLLETNVKPYHSAKNKMLQHRIKNPMELSDLVRGRLFFSEEYDAKEVLELLKQLLGNKIKKVDQKDTNDCGLSYNGVTDVNMNIDGVNFELQLMPMSYKPHQELSHHIYDTLRTQSDKLTDVQKDFLKNTHNKIYHELASKSRSNRNG